MAVQTAPTPVDAAYQAFLIARSRERAIRKALEAAQSLHLAAVADAENAKTAWWRQETGG